MQVRVEIKGVHGTTEESIEKAESIEKVVEEWNSTEKPYKNV